MRKKTIAVIAASIVLLASVPVNAENKAPMPLAHNVAVMRPKTPEPMAQLTAMPTSGNPSDEECLRMFSGTKAQALKSCHEMFTSWGSDAQIKAPAKVDFQSYVTAIQQKIEANWHPPVTARQSHLVAVFTVNKDGGLGGVRLKNSGTPEENNAALLAVYQSAPFAPLPAGFADKSVDVEFQFHKDIPGIQQRPQYQQQYSTRQTQELQQAQKSFTNQMLVNSIARPILNGVTAPLNMKLQNALLYGH